LQTLKYINLKKNLILITIKKKENGNLKILSQARMLADSFVFITARRRQYIFMSNIAGQVYRNGELVITNDTGLVSPEDLIGPLVRHRPVVELLFIVINALLLIFYTYYMFRFRPRFVFNVWYLFNYLSIDKIPRNVGKKSICHRCPQGE